MAEHVEPLALGVTWEPNVPDAVLVSRDDGTTVLALNANPDDADQRCVVLVWTMARAASMADPNDEAISGHRLYGKGLAEVRWAGVVEGSQLTSELEKQNRAHPQHDPAQFNALAHHVMLLKECTVEVVATAVAAAVLVERSAGPTPKAAMAVISR